MHRAAAVTRPPGFSGTHRSPEWMEPDIYELTMPGLAAARFDKDQ
jgi:hypothetical protein